MLSSSCVDVHGIEVDTGTMQARLPQDKLEAAINLVRSFSRRKKVTAGAAVPYRYFELCL